VKYKEEDVDDEALAGNMMLCNRNLFL